MSGERVLIVEDEPAVARGLEYGLEADGYQVFWAETGSAALERVRKNDPHLILLDIRLPDINGFDVCSQLRKEGWRMPIVMLTARDEEVDKVLGLELGADDYIVKPYSLREVLSRIRAHLRRSYGELAIPVSDNQFRFGDTEIDFDQFLARRGGEPISLTPTEFRLLHQLVRHPNHPLSRSNLIEAIWGYDSDIGNERTIDVHIRHLRAKLEEDPSNPQWIITVRGLGYKFQPRF
jgi:two-component system alkaline phosphatase synthesis response regulator PhoP